MRLAHVPGHLALDALCRLALVATGSLALVIFSSLALVAPALAFCGFFAASGNASLFNHSSQVVLVRDGDRTAITMASDFQGDARDFALVVPVPTVLRRDQIRVAERAPIDHLDQFSAPRLVEYWDEDPCRIEVAEREEKAASRMTDMAAPRGLALGALKRGVTIEARYVVGEYDILILSARESEGLATWLTEHHYRIPKGAAPVLRAYLRQGMKFFVAKVNLAEQARLGFSNLRPLQITYTSPKFMLPVRLGMANANGAQELFVYAITKDGRVEPVNYRGVRLPTGDELPEFVKGDFPHLYRDLFAHQTELEGGGVVFTEYAWDMTWCDPCAAPPLDPSELRALGVWWADGASPANVFLTRLHASYDRATFPEDLSLQVTHDRENFQGRYVIRHEWTGNADCPAAREYRRALPARHAAQLRALVNLTGWSPRTIRERMTQTGALVGADDPLLAALRPSRHAHWPFGR